MPTAPSLPLRSAILLGLALGGFFDGILLHQVLQWHHLLSNLQAPGWADLRTQLLADGLFHGLMYLLALAGLSGLWRRRSALPAAGAGARLLAGALAGFGGWHVLDAVLSHWLTGIHRVRTGVPDPLFWDLLWLAVFGLVPLLAAAWLRRRGGDGGGGRRTAAGLGVAVLLAGPIAARQAPAGDAHLVLFAPGTSAAQAFDALARLDGRVRWVDAAGGVWSVAFERPPSTTVLLRERALLVSGSLLAVGCLGQSRVALP